MPGVPYGAIPRPTAAQRAQGPMSLSELRAVTDPTQVASRLYNRMIAQPAQFAANLGRQAMTDPNWGYTLQGEIDPQAVQQSLRAATLATTGSAPASALEPIEGMVTASGMRTPPLLGERGQQMGANIAAGNVTSRAATNQPRFTPEDSRRALQAFLAAGGT